MQIQVWNLKGTCASLPKLLKWLKETKGIEVTYDRLHYYVQKMGFEWCETKKKGELFESPRILEWKRKYISKRVFDQVEGKQQPTYFLDETYIHQNHAPKYTW